MLTPSDRCFDSSTMTIEPCAAGHSLHPMDAFLRSIQNNALHMAQIGCGDREQGFDILQDAMSAFVRRYSNKPVAQWRPLFYRTLQNRIKDHYRKRRVRLRWRQFLYPRIDQPDPIQEMPDPRANSPEAQTTDSQFRHALQQAVGDLPQRQQQTFLLRVLEGYDVAQTADIMSVSQGSVKTHLSRALSTLRARLEQFSHE